MPSRRTPISHNRPSPKLTGTQARRLLEALLDAERAHQEQSSIPSPASRNPQDNHNNSSGFVQCHPIHAIVPGPFTLTTMSSPAQPPRNPQNTPNRQPPPGAAAASHPFRTYPGTFTGNQARSLFFPLPTQVPPANPPQMKVTKNGNTVTVDSSTRLIGHLNVLAIPSAVNVMQQAESLADVIGGALNGPDTAGENADPTASASCSSTNDPNTTSENADANPQATNATDNNQTSTDQNQAKGQKHINLFINASISVVGSRNNIIMSTSPSAHPALTYVPPLHANTAAADPAATAANQGTNLAAAAEGGGPVQPSMTAHQRDTMPVVVPDGEGPGGVMLVSRGVQGQGQGKREDGGEGGGSGEAQGGGSGSDSGNGMMGIA